MPLRQSTRKQKMKECKELFFVVKIQGIISEMFLLASYRVCVQFLCVHGDASGPVPTVRTPCNPDQGEERASRVGGLPLSFHLSQNTTLKKNDSAVITRLCTVLKSGFRQGMIHRHFPFVAHISQSVVDLTISIFCNAPNTRLCRSFFPISRGAL